MFGTTRRRAVLALACALGVAALTAAKVAAPAHATYDGRNGRIVFGANTGSGFQLYTIRPNGRGLRQITQVAGDALNPDWSPDGRSIVFELATEEGASIALIDRDGGGLTNLTPEPVCCQGQPSFAPDGRHIYFERTDIVTGDDAVWRMNVDGRDQRRIVGPWSPGFATDPNVSPDGRTLSIVGFNGLIGPPPAFEPAQGLFTTRIDGTGLAQLLPFDVDLANKSDWAPDGRHLVVTTNANFFHEGESANIATIRPDGTGLRYLTHFTGGQVNAFAGSYSPDGKWIVFRFEDHGLYGLYKMTPDGTHIRELLPLSTFRPRFIDWGPSPTGHDDEDEE